MIFRSTLNQLLPSSRILPRAAAVVHGTEMIGAIAAEPGATVGQSFPLLL